jgi:CRP-like cAMP-binding protein
VASTEYGGLLAELGPEASDELCRRGTTRRFPRGAIMMLEGDPSNSLYVLLEGRVKASSFGLDGREVLLSVHGPGEGIGIIGAIDGATRSATVTCLESCVVAIVDRDVMRAFVEERPDTAFAFLRAVCWLFRYTNQRQIDLSARAVLGRTSAQLADMATRFGVPVDDGGIRIDMPVTHEQLAAAVGTSREAVGKALQQLQKLGLVAHRRRELTVLDLDRLVEHVQ